MLAYRLPREPSNPRVVMWRKLRRLGAVQLVDSLVALPSDARTREQLDWLADEVTEAGGEATVWLARAGSAAQERALARRMADTVAEDYRAVVDEAAGATSARTLARLRRELHRIAQRDHFPPPERQAAQAAVRGLAGRLAADQATSR